MDNKAYEAQAEYFKALSHPVRIKIVHYLKEGERCVCEIVPHIKEEQSNVSRHLAALRRVGILFSRKEGVNVYYGIKDEDASKVLDLALCSIEKTAREKIAILS